MAMLLTRLISPAISPISSRRTTHRSSADRPQARSDRSSSPTPPLASCTRRRHAASARVIKSGSSPGYRAQRRAWTRKSAQTPLRSSIRTGSGKIRLMIRLWLPSSCSTTVTHRHSSGRSARFASSSHARPIPTASLRPMTCRRPPSSQQQTERSVPSGSGLRHASASASRRSDRCRTLPSRLPARFHRSDPPKPCRLNRTACERARSEALTQEGPLLVRSFEPQVRRSGRRVGPREGGSTHAGPSPRRVGSAMIAVRAQRRSCSRTLRSPP